MRKLFRRDPWTQRPGNWARGVADPTLMAILLVALCVLLGLDSVEVDEVRRWLKTIYDTLVVL